MNRRRTLGALVSVMAGGLAGGRARAQSLVDTVRIYVGYPAGGTTDIVARRIGDKLRGTLGKAVIVENRPGAAGRLALNELRTPRRDTIALVVQPDATLTLVQHVDPKNAVYRLADLTAISPCAVMRHVVAVGPATPASVRTLQDFIAWAKANPTLANYATPGIVTPQRFLMTAVSKASGVPLTHVPYKGSQPAVMDVLAGQVPAMCSPMGDWLPHLANPAVRILAIASDKRSSFAPDVPTLKEAGFPGIAIDEHFGIVMAKDTPAALAQDVARAVAAAVAAPDVIQEFSRLGLEPLATTPEAFTEILQAGIRDWGEKVRASGFVPE